MQKIIDWFKSLSKSGKVAIMLIIGAFIVLALYYVVVPKSFLSEAEEESSLKTMLLSLQEATMEETDTSKLDVYSRNSLSSASDSPEDYWASLAQKREREHDSVDNAESSGLLPQNQGISRGSGGYNDVYLDPRIYSEMEIAYIRQGVYTKEEIDARHTAESRSRERVSRPKTQKMTQAQKDSAYFARVEKAFAIASNYTQGSSTPASSVATTEDVQAQPVPEPVPVVEEPRVIETPISNDSDVVMSSGGIVSSLDVATQGVTMQRDGNTVRPAKATFLKTERVIAGNRVTMRLMEDLHLSNGVVIPVNTHLMGTCKMDGRLRISVATICYSDRIFQCPLTVYDNDGVEGIYCPVFDKSNARKVGGEVGTEVASGVVSGVATAFGGRLFGRAAQQGINSISSIAMSDGSVAIDIVSGYEFYLCEESKKK